jgi:hypothetical protein
MKRIIALLKPKQGLLTVLLVFIVCFSFAQSKHAECGCPKSTFDNTKADTIFRLSNGKTIALCGYRDKDIAEQDGKLFFSEFVLSVCGDNKIIKFWGAVEECQLRVVKDTLLVETMVNLPTGKNMAFKWTVWTIEHIYFVKGKPVKDFAVNRQIPKYNQQQMASALKQYEQAKKEISDANMEISDKLFISAISGSQKARSYLSAFKYRFGVLDGAYAEWYNDVMRMLKLWDTNIPSQDNF